MMMAGTPASLAERARGNTADLLRKQYRNSYLLLSLVTWIAGLALTAWGGNWLDDNARSSAQMRFERYHGKIEAAVKSKFDSVLPGLKGLQSTYMALGGDMQRLQFRTWVQERQLAVDFPGIRGLGFIKRVERDDLNAFVAAERGDHAPDFQVKTKGNAPDLLVIKFIEPLMHNTAAWGFDVGQEAVRRQAAQAAIDSGQPAMTGRITLVQDGKKRAGFLYFLPIYRKDQPQSNPAQRRAALLGLLYSPVVVEELLTSISQTTDALMDLELFDGDIPDKQKLLFDQDGHFVVNPEATQKRSFYKTQVLQVGGRPLLLQTSTKPAFDAETHQPESLRFQVTGFLLSTLMAVVIWLMGMGRAHAESRAIRMTADLRAAKNQAENALRDSAALIDTLNRYSLVSVTDACGTILKVNDAFCRISGYDREELIGRTHQLINSGYHDESFWQDFWQTLHAGQPWHGNICNRSKNGSIYWVNSIIAPFLDADGNIESIISIRQDITRSKQLETERELMAERYTLAIDGGSDGLWDWIDVHGHAHWWSPQFYKLLGYEPDEIPADLVTFERMLHPSDIDRANLAVEMALKQHQPFDIEYRLKTKQGEYRWFRSRAKVYFDETGDAKRMAGSIQDIHDRQEVKLQLKETIDQMHSVFSLSPDAFVAFNHEGLITYASPALQPLTGLACQHVIGMSEGQLIQALSQSSAMPLSALSFSQLPAHRDAVLPAERERQLTHTVIELNTPTHRLLDVQLHKGTEDTVSQILHIRDVTQTVELDRMKSEFMSMAAHELRTPMSSIYGFTELLLTREFKPDKQKELLGKIYRQSEGMITIINELLDIARIESRRGKDFRLQPLNLLEMVEQVVSDYQVPEDRHPPHVAVASCSTNAWGDEMKMKQALLNLISNAYKYSPQGGEVSIDFLSEQQGENLVGRVGVRIKDHGIGMTPDQMARLGERFFRADKSGRIPGTGLGISIVREIMSLMNGDMDVHSEIGKGTTITLWLPPDELVKH